MIEKRTTRRKNGGAYAPTDFSSLKGIQGFSDELLETHFALYDSCVEKTNALLAKLEAHRDGDAATSELRRRFGWEWNGMRLHELYFGNLGETRALSPTTELFGKLEKEFESFASFRDEFRTLGEMCGVGWVVLYYDPVGDRLFNTWIEEHHVAHLTGSVPLLVMDVWEHAYLVDYRLRRSDYIDAFLANVNWTSVRMRLQTGLESKRFTIRA